MIWKVGLWHSSNRTTIWSIQNWKIWTLQENEMRVKDKMDRERDRDREQKRCFKEILRPVAMEEDSTTL